METETKTEVPKEVRSDWGEVGLAFANWFFSSCPETAASVVWSNQNVVKHGCDKPANLPYVQVMLQAAIVKQLEKLNAGVARLAEVVQEELGTVRRQNAALDHRERDRLIAVLERLYALKSIP